MLVEARLRAFAALAREGSFSRAAESLYISQPAVSRHIASLEAEVGVGLVARPGAKLTLAGETLAGYVLRAEALLATAGRALAAINDPETGTLAVAASGVPGTYLLPTVLARFVAERPSVVVDIRLSTSFGAMDLVRAHQVELAVVGGLTIPAELTAEELADDEIVLIGPAALSGRRLSPKNLEAFVWLSREEGSSTRSAMDAARRQLGLHSSPGLELPSWEAVKLAVAAGAGIAAISRSAIDTELRAGTLVVLDVPRWHLSRTIVAVRSAAVPLTPPAQHFLDLLREHVGVIRTAASGALS
jgi:DNA-binding transcriptional LysR family regulator